MANVLKPKRSSTAGLVPTTSNLASGEIGVNMADQKIWINNGTSVIQLGAGKLSGLSDVALTSLVTGQSLSWNGTNWVNSSAGTGTVTSIVAGTGLTGGTISTSGTLALATSGVTAGTYPKVTVDAYGRVTAGAALATADLPTTLQTNTYGPGLTGSTSNAVTAAGTTQGTATALTSDVNIITTSTAGTGLGVVVQGATSGKYVVIVNRSANAINVYPASGHAFDGLGANTPISLPVNGFLEMFGSSTTQWHTTYQALTQGQFVVGNISGSAGSVANAHTAGTGLSGSTYNGSAAVTWSLATSGVTAGTYTKVTVDAYGRVTTGASLASADLPTYTGTITSSQITTGLGFTPYNATNPNGYITSSALSSYLPLTGGTLTGSRPITFDLAGGGVQIKGDAGGWATGLYFVGSSGTNRGGFGALGSADALTNFWVGPAYNNTWMTWSSSAVNAQVALQQSGNQVLHAGNYTSYSPSLTGSGASGTWSINVTGNAGTVTNGVYTTSAVLIDKGSASSAVDWNTLTTAGIYQVGAASFTGANTPSSAYPYGQLVISTNGTIVVQQYFTHTSPATIWTRVKYNAADWQPWSVGLNSGNYNSYSPTLTGSGASGTWGINVTGNAATVGGYGRRVDLSDFTTWDASKVGAVGWYAFTGGPTAASYHHGYRSAMADTAYGNEIAVRYDSDNIFFRRINGGVFGTWRELLHAANYNSYSPSLTGSGASGTWGISVSGNAATVTSITSGQVTTALGFTPYNASNPSGYTSNTGTVTSVGGTGTVSGLTLTGTVTGSGNLTLGGTLSLTSGNVTTALGYTPLSTGGGTLTGLLTTVQGNGNGISLNAAGSGYIFGTSGDGASSTVANVKLTSWNGIGFGPSISGQTVTQWENACWIDARIGAFSARSNITAYASDVRLKQNFVSISSALAKIRQIGGYEFDWDVELCESLGFAPSNKHEHGVKAQEIRAVVPDAVTLAPFDDNGEGVSKSGKSYLTVRYEKMVPLLIEGIKEQDSEVATLKLQLEVQAKEHAQALARVAKLEALVSKLIEG